MTECVVGENTGMVGGVVVEIEERGIRNRELRNCNLDRDSCIFYKRKKCRVIEGPELSVPLQGFVLDCGK